MGTLDGKVAIITGAARGIGKAIAERFVAEGASVVISDIMEDAGKATAAELAKSGKAVFIAADVGDAASVAKLVEGAKKAFTGEIDILINNAGIVHSAEFLDLAEADFDKVLRVNLKGSFLVGQAVAKVMVEQVKAGKTPGAIVNMSSVNARLAIVNQIPYCVSKGGVSQLTNVMALGLSEWGIRVNAIGPGSIATEMLASVNTDKTARHRLFSRTPLRRLGEPDEIAKVAVFLASDAASYVTGQTIYADGGRLGLNYTVPVAD
ncbi:SDR family oxidoreductase [Phreatobacter aquaticus]|uniref:SDR family oxidoreductase n=1 Tax=Phreatobacter aquaticus TaxID=2570229 RepID=A0A4D7QX60_9HYPH|nr:SDR family NAD(P)-dependent oxidoreductase [Phreatobacter aquaticus]QCK88462.1 SDR family oxidoreductase [Phreatobacter aquaticus]